MTHFFTLTPGTDTFTGVAGDYNAFQFTPATLQSTDTITGGATGSFLDILLATAGGTILSSQFQGVTNVEQLNLSSGGNNVTLSNSVVAGSSVGYFAIVDGGGNDTVDATPITATPIVFFAGAGGDTFKGGGGNDAVFIAPTDLTSADTFQGGAGADNLYLNAGGTVAAAAFTNVTGFEGLGLSSLGNNVTLTNGMVTGTSSGYFAINDGGGNDTVDASAVTATPIVFFAKAGNDTFKGGGGNDAVYIAVADLTSGDTLQGGAGVDNLYLTTTGTIAASAFTNVTGFEGLALSGLGNNVTLSNSLVAGSNNGVFAVVDGAGNDTVDASGVNNGSSIVFFGSGGGDTFKGGNGLNGYVFAASNLTSADTVQGGSAVDNLIISTAGTLGASTFTNVTGVEAILLANGTNNVTLTNGLVAGTSIGYFAVSGGTGNDTVDASGVTNGKAIAFYGITGGSDSFTGGNGNDSFLFAAGQLTAADTVVGGGGADTLWMTTAGTTTAANLAGVSGIEGVYLQNGGSFTLANGITAAAGISATGSAAVDTFDASTVTTYSVSFTGNGGADTLTGGSQNDTFYIADSAFAAINGNAGIDRITLTAPSQSFNLTTNAAKISNIEVIDLNSSLNSTLTLAGADIAVVNSAGNSLYVVGDVDDTVNAGNGYTQIASGVVNNAVAPGHTFFEFQHSGGSLLFVDSAILALTATAGSGTANVPEGVAPGTSVFNAQQPGAGVNYVLGGADQALFSIDGTGHISFNASPNFESPLDQGGNNVYDLTVTSSNGSATPNFVETVTITVTDVAPTAPTDSNLAANTVAEGAANGSTVGITASSTDVNGPAVTYALTGDTSLGGFTIDAATGVVTVADTSKINFESSGGGYTVTAQASDGHGGTSSQAFTITVSNAPPSTPVDSDVATADHVAEGAEAGTYTGITASSTDVNGPAVTYALTGDTSLGGFTIDAATGVVTVADASKINFESSGGSYTVTAQASDGAGGTSAQTFTIAVDNVVPSTPVDGDLAIADSVAEGAAIGTYTGVTASSTDVNGPAVTWSLTADSSGSGFAIDSTGKITVNDSTKIDFESSSGSYTVTAQASDGAGGTSSQTFTIAVTDVAPSTPADSDVAANTVVAGAPAGTYTGLTAHSTDVNGPVITAYTLIADTSGGGFTIDSTGKVTVLDPAKVVYNLGSPTYDVMVDAFDGALHSQHTFTINVSPNAPPAIDSDGSGATAAKSVAENTTAVTTVHATDPDSSPSPVSYSIVGGDDAALFNIVASGAGAGTLTFITPPDFENPTDTLTAGSNTYIVTVRAFDGAAFDDQTITVTVTDANEAPVITSNLGGATASINVNENSTAVTTVTATDQDVPAQTLTYSLAGGADQGKFAINSSTGVLTFIAAPNFEAPTDVGTDNAYDVVVRVTDNGAPNLHDDQAITVHVQDVNEAPNTNAITTSGAEDATSIAITITGTDVDAGDSVASFHITGVPGGGQGVLYSDAGLTTVVTSGTDVAATGNAATLYFVPAANFNGPVTFQAAATDAHGPLTDATPATETINVTAVDDAPVNNGVPVNFTVMSGFTHAITGLSITDIDANEGGTATDITTTLTSAGGGAVTVGAVGGGAAIAGNGSGTVTLTGSIAQINASLAGSVVYTAADGATSSSTTTLTIATNDHGHTGTGGPITDTDIIQVGVTPQVWFINGDQSTLDANAPRGSQTNPFSDVTEFNASSGPGVNDYIYVKAGTYTGPGINLKDGQTLLGDDQALSLADPFGGPAIVIETAAGTRPTIHVTTAGDQGIDLGANNTVAGIDIQTDLGTTGLDDGQGGGGNAVGTLNVSHMAISGAGQAVDIDQGGALNVTLDSITSTGGAEGVQLAGTASSGAGLLSGSFSGGSGAISGSTTAGFLVGNGAGGTSTGGTATITYNGTITASNAASVVNIQDHTTGAVTLSGNLTHNGTSGAGIVLDDNNSNFTFSGSAVNLNTGSSNAINITDQTGSSTVAFSGTLNIDTTTGTGVNLGGTSTGTFNFTGGNLTIDTTTAGGQGFIATGGGTVSVTGTGNHISTTTGTALNISNTTIGSGNVTFHDISANGGTNGIVLNNTGSGGLTVTGTGTTAGSGGTIQNTDQGALFTSASNITLKHMNFTNANTGNGTNNNVDTNTGGTTFNAAGKGAINLNSVTNVSLDGLVMDGGVQSGINGRDVAGLTIANSTIKNFGDAVFENILRLFNLTGTSSFTNSTFQKPGDIIADIRNDTGTLNLTIDGVTFNDTASSAFGAAGLSITSTGSSTVTANIDNSFFTAIKNAGYQAFAKSSSTLNTNVTDSTFDPASAASGGIGRAIEIGATQTAHANFNINHNLKLYAKDGIAVNIFGFNSGVLQGRIDNNTDIRGGGVGSPGDGIAIHPEDDAQAIVEVIGNTITGIGSTTAAGIHAFNHGDGGSLLSPVLDVTIKNNNINLVDNGVTGGGYNGGLFGVWVQAGANAGDTATTYVNVSGNTVTATGGVPINGSDNTAFNTREGSGASHLYFENIGAGANNAAKALATWNNNGNTPAFTNTGDVGSPPPQPYLAVPGSHNTGHVLTPTNPSALLAATGGVASSTNTPGETHLSQAQLDIIVQSAIDHWAAAGVSAAQLAVLQHVTYDVADITPGWVGASTPGHVTIDVNADGHGWFIDPTPGDNSEFTHTVTASHLTADPTEGPAGHLDLLTTVMHEMGEQLGLEDTYASANRDGLMYGNLVDGERRLPDAADVAQANASVAQGNTIGPQTSGVTSPVSAPAPLGGPVMVATAGADGFVFGPEVLTNAPAPMPLAHIVNYSAAQGDIFDFGALTSQFHGSGISDAMVVRAVEDASGSFATLQVNSNSLGLKAGPTWVNVAQLDGAHAGDAVNVLVDNQAMTTIHLAQIHIDLLV